MPRSQLAVRICKISFTIIDQNITSGAAGYFPGTTLPPTNKSISPSPSISAAFTQPLLVKHLRQGLSFFVKFPLPSLRYRACLAMQDHFHQIHNHPCNIQIFIAIIVSIKKSAATSSLIASFNNAGSGFSGKCSVCILEINIGELAFLRHP